MAEEEKGNGALGRGHVFSDKDEVKSKTRLFSASRRWPAFCGRNVGRLSRDECLRQLDGERGSVDGATRDIGVRQLDGNYRMSTVDGKRKSVEVDGARWDDCRQRLDGNRKIVDGKRRSVDVDGATWDEGVHQLDGNYRMSTIDGKRRSVDVDGATWDKCLQQLDGTRKSVDVQRKSVHVGGATWDKCLQQLHGKSKSVDGATGEFQEDLRETVEGAAGSYGQKVKFSMSKDGGLSKHEQLDGRVMDGIGKLVSSTVVGSELPRRSVSAVGEWPMLCGPNVARMSREECLWYLAEKKRNKAAALLSERQGIDDGDVVPSHGSQQKPKPLVPGGVVDVGQGRMSRTADGSKYKQGKVCGHFEAGAVDDTKQSRFQKGSELGSGERETAPVKGPGSRALVTLEESVNCLDRVLGVEVKKRDQKLIEVNKQTANKMRSELSAKLHLGTAKQCELPEVISRSEALDSSPCVEIRLKLEPADLWSPAIPNVKPISCSAIVKQKTRFGNGYHEIKCPPGEGCSDLVLTKVSPAEDEADVKGGDNFLVDSDELVVRHRKKVRDSLRLFHLLCRKFSQEAENKDRRGRNRVDLRAHEVFRQTGRLINEPTLGVVPGVEVGDEFQYRAELCIIGFHCQLMAGIDYLRGSKTLATSIVSAGAYDDQIDDSDVMIYTGEGGRPTQHKAEAENQKLTKGNVALINSIRARTPVRVIRGIRETQKKGKKQVVVTTYTYYGLYLVEKYWMEKGRYGFLEFKFQLRRIEGQPNLAVRELQKAKKLNVREGICVDDISKGEEEMPICAVNTIDNAKPATFTYVARMKYHHDPTLYKLKPIQGCNCTDGCFDSEKCSCAVKNGGDFPYNYDGAIVYPKSLVYECGPSCRCPPSCYNRVTQRGIKLTLELFKTENRGWAVRSLSSIPPGTFICEYVGEMLQESEAELRVGSDEYLFDIGRSHNAGFDLQDELISTYVPNLRSISVSEVEHGGFTIDAALYGNVGRFINHSCTPNLYAQDVLYDHDDKRMPHVMFFAAKNIPPLQELTYDYNIAVDQVLDSDGNIKKKECFCGSSECTGRLY